MVKRLLFLSLITMTAYLARASTYYGFKIGGESVNSDDQVNSADVSALYSAILGNLTDAIYDVNGDGSVNAGDVSTLYGIILSK